MLEMVQTQLSACDYIHSRKPKQAVNQIDVKNAFLHCDLQKVCMSLSLGLSHLWGECKVYQLKISYKLKQSPHAWFGKFSSALL